MGCVGGHCALCAGVVVYILGRPSSTDMRVGRLHINDMLSTTAFGTDEIPSNMTLICIQCIVAVKRGKAG